MTTGDIQVQQFQKHGLSVLPAGYPSLGIEVPDFDADDELFGGLRQLQDAYTVGEQLGEGTYGFVSWAKDNRTQERIALKEVRLENIDYREGFPITSLREIKLLASLEHENVLKLKEIVRGPGEKGLVTIYLAFEYLDHDLSGLCMRNKFKLPQVKCIMKQLLQGLAYCHLNNVMHRDLKPSNILVNQRGELKLADFGLARTYVQAPEFGKHREAYTPRVITLWYRPPELFMGPKNYGPEVDVWSVGCILAELLTGKALFPGDGSGNNELDQLDKIFAVLGGPSEENWPGVTQLPGYDIIKPMVARHSRPTGLRPHLARYGVKDESVLQLLEQLLSLDPSKRISAMDALKSSFFWEDPLPCATEDLVKSVKHSCHEFTTKKRIREERGQSQQQASSQQKRAKPAGSGYTYLWGEAPPHGYNSRGPYGSNNRARNDTVRKPGGPSGHAVRPIMPPPKFHESQPAASTGGHRHAANPYAPASGVFGNGVSNGSNAYAGSNSSMSFKQAHLGARSNQKQGRPLQPSSGAYNAQGWRPGPNSKSQNAQGRPQAVAPYSQRPVGFRAS